MPFPQVPFTANVSGSPVFSPDGAREWADGVSIDGVTVIALFGDKARIGDPAWSNGKQWCVYQSAVTPVSEPPPVDPPTGVTKTHTIEVYSDGSITIDGSPYP